MESIFVPYPVAEEVQRYVHYTILDVHVIPTNAMIHSQINIKGIMVLIKIDIDKWVVSNNYDVGIFFVRDICNTATHISFEYPISISYSCAILTCVLYRGNKSVLYLHGSVYTITQTEIAQILLNSI